MLVWDHSYYFEIPVVDYVISYYTFFYRIGFFIGSVFLVSIFFRFFKMKDSINNLGRTKKDLWKESLKISAICSFPTIICLHLGARLGHFLFYENPAVYLSKPWILLYVWQGGRSSHGGGLMALLSCFLVAQYLCRKNPDLTFFRIGDFVFIPAAFCMGLIRVGNFFNQEILGSPTDLPWGVLFANPIVGNPIASFLHPVQLYESFCYFAIFIVLWRLSYNPNYFLKEGKLFGLSIVMLCSARILCEIFKTEASNIMPDGFFLTTGQILSVPLLMFGLFVYYKDFILEKFFNRISKNNGDV